MVLDTVKLPGVFDELNDDNDDDILVASEMDLSCRHVVDLATCLLQKESRINRRKGTGTSRGVDIERMAFHCTGRYVAAGALIKATGNRSVFLSA